MPNLTLIEGAIAPLFDRLRTAKSGREQQPLQALTRQQLCDSVRRELTHLFNTCSPTSPEVYATRELTVIDYGIPDLTAFSPQNGRDIGHLASCLTRAVAAFEPRLVEVTVDVARVADRPQSLRVGIQAMLKVESFVEPIYLSTILPDPDGDSEVQLSSKPFMPTVK